MEFNPKNCPGKKSIAGLLSLPPKDHVRAPTTVWLSVYPWKAKWPNWCVPLERIFWLLLVTLGTQDSEKLEESSVQNLATSTRVLPIFLEWHQEAKKDSQHTPRPCHSEPLLVWGTIFLFFSSFFQRLYLFPFSLVHSAFRKVRQGFSIQFGLGSPKPPFSARQKMQQGQWSWSWLK